MVDGASYWQRVQRITLPLTAKTILLVTLVSVIGSLLAFDQFFLMTAGQPFNQTASSVFWMYLNSFPYLKLGYGAALSLILAVIVLVLHRRCRLMLTRAQAGRDGPHAVERRHAADRRGARERVRARSAGLRPAGARRAAQYLIGAICMAHLRRSCWRRLCFRSSHRSRRRRRRRQSRRPISPTHSASTATPSCGTTRRACRPISSTAPARRC